jgi:hypothetical protein
MMARRTRVLLVNLAVSFLTLTAYDVSVNGYLEPATLNPAHLAAGAGSTSLLVRAWLCLAVVIASFPAFIVREPSARSVRRAGVVALATVVVFVWSAIGIQREAPRFDDAEFRRIVEGMLAGNTVSKQDVLARLGRPLIAGPCEGRECWSYTYMPSGGFGWRHRVFVFDAAGIVVSWDGHDEP